MEALSRLRAALLALMQRISVWFVVRQMRREPGQGLVEYGLILILVMVVCVVIVGTTGQTIKDVWYEKLIKPVWGP